MQRFHYATKIKNTFFFLNEFTHTRTHMHIEYNTTHRFIYAYIGQMDKVLNDSASHENICVWTSIIMARTQTMYNDNARCNRTKRSNWSWLAHSLCMGIFSFRFCFHYLWKSECPATTHNIYYIHWTQPTKARALLVRVKLIHFNW